MYVCEGKNMENILSKYTLACLRVREKYFYISSAGEITYGSIIFRGYEADSLLRAIFVRQSDRSSNYNICARSRTELTWRFDRIGRPALTRR